MTVPTATTFVVVVAKWPGKPVRGSEVFWKLKGPHHCSIWREACFSPDGIHSRPFPVTDAPSFNLLTASSPWCEPPHAPKGAACSLAGQPEQSWPPGSRVRRPLGPVNQPLDGYAIIFTSMLNKLALNSRTRRKARALMTRYDLSKERRSKHKPSNSREKSWEDVFKEGR